VHGTTEMGRACCEGEEQDREGETRGHRNRVAGTPSETQGHSSNLHVILLRGPEAFSLAQAALRRLRRRASTEAQA